MFYLAQAESPVVDFISQNPIILAVVIGIIALVILIKIVKVAFKVILFLVVIGLIIAGIALTMAP